MQWDQKEELLTAGESGRLASLTPHWKGEGLRATTFDFYYCKGRNSSSQDGQKRKERLQRLLIGRKKNGIWGDSGKGETRLENFTGASILTTQRGRAGL